MGRQPQHRTYVRPARAAGLAMMLVAAAPPALAEPHTYKIDPEHFSIGFMVEHVDYNKLLGMFLEGQGQFVYDEDSRQLSSGRVEITADSVFSNHDERDEHLRGEDFLDASEHPTIVFTATDYQPQGDKKGKLKGDLSLLGETHPVTLDVTINKAAEYPFGHGKYTLGISARTTIERSRWGMDYAVDNGLVGDEVELMFEFEAIRQ